jgi:hypothetical protein
MRLSSTACARESYSDVILRLAAVGPESLNRS